MSKMSDIALQLSEQAVEYGLQGYQEALERGFTYEVAQDGTATLISPSEGLEMAHEEWLKEKEGVLADLRKLLNDYLPTGEQDEIKALERAIDFVEEAHD